MADLGTFCTTANVQYLAGANASATSKAEGYTNIYVQMVEGFIMCAIRYDMKTNYSGAKAEIKELLREATATLAAVYVIQFDMSGYTSRIESENMINILYERHKKAMALLADQKTITYGK